MDKGKLKIKQRERRHHRIRAKVKGTKKIPRLSIFRSNKGLYAQLINDEKGETLVSASGKEVIGKSKVKSKKSKVKSKDTKTKKRKIKKKITKLEQAREVGKLIAKKALKKKIQKIVFDRGGYKYHGRVKAVAEGAREEGLKF